MPAPSRYHLLHQIDASLARLGLDHVDLYQIHGWDPNCGMEEALRALEDIVRSGRARYVGVSNWAAWQIAKALGIAERRGWDKFVSLQALYTVANRELERELVPMMRSEGLGLMVWSPLAGGLLSGKYARGADDKAEGEGRRAKLDFPRIDKALAFALVEAMRPMAESRGVAVSAIALAWLLHQEVVSTVIVGARRRRPAGREPRRERRRADRRRAGAARRARRARARVPGLGDRLAGHAPRLPRLAAPPAQ